MLRSMLVVLHRWFGLGIAVFLAIAGITGAVISWDHELDAWLNPQFHQARAPGPPLPALQLAARVEQADPRVRVRYLPLAAPPGQALTIAVEPRFDPTTQRPTQPGYNQVIVDPADGRILARRDWGKVSLARENLLPFLYKLHYSLHLPDGFGLELGIWFMGLVAIVWVIDTLVAVWIAFPNRRSWRQSFAFRWRAGGHRLVFDLHRSGALWVYALVLMLAVTSVAMNLREPVVRPIVAAFSALAPSPFASRTPLAPEHQAEPKLTPAQAIELAHTQALARGIDAPPGGLFLSSEIGVWGVGFFAPGNDHGDGGLGNPWIYLDANTGAPVGADIPGTGSAGDIFLQSMFPLHSGRILGTAGRVIVSALGIVVTMLSLTGVLIWARKRRARAMRL